MRLNAFDKACAASALALGAVLLVQGVAGVYWPATFSFEVARGVAVLLAPVGWGIIKSVVVAWSHSRA